MHVTVLVQLNELMDPESGFLGREGLILRVDVLECCPWFEFADLETYTSGMAPRPSAHASCFGNPMRSISLFCKLKEAAGNMQFIFAYVQLFR